MQEMKDSGIEWIGKIPKEWNLKKIKNAIFYISSGTTPPSGKSEFYEDGTINWIQSGDLYGKNEINEVSTNVTKYAVKLFSALHIYKAKFIVIAMYGGSVGNIAISNIDACVNQACCCIQVDKYNDLKFMYYWLFSCKSDFLRITDGGGQPNISQTKIKNQYYLQPPLPEQHRIADFLDAKCAELDSLFSDIKKQIDILEQYKRSVITEAVTKGLDKNVQMKDSGIEWIGKIPEGWKNITKIKYECNLNGRIGWQGLTSSEYIDEGPFLITGVDFCNGAIDWNSCAHVSEWRYNQAPDIFIKDDDLLITKDGTVGKVAIVSNAPEKVTLNSGVLLIRPKSDRYINKFLFYVLLSDEFHNWFTFINSGNTTILHLYQHIFENFSFPLPPLSE